MASTFFGLNIATNGVYAAQAALNTTSHNISNRNTEGFTRQVASQSATEALRMYAKYGMVGSGVEVKKIQQMRDTYYDIKFRTNASIYGSYKTKNHYNRLMEDHFNETNVEGFTAEYDNLFNSLEELKNNPSDLTARTQVLNMGASISDYLNKVASEYKKLQTELNTEISNKVDQMKVLSKQIATLTKQINTIELTGQDANDLRDKRNLLLDGLAEIVPIQVTEDKMENGKTNFLVKSSGYTLVENYDAHSLVVVARENKQSSLDMPGLYDVYFYYDEISTIGTKFDVQGVVNNGELKALFDLRDGNNGEVETGNPYSEPVNYKGVPHFLNQLNGFIETFATSFNDIHHTGYDLYGTPTAAVDLFVLSGNGSLKVNEELIRDPNKMATSIAPPHLGVEDSELVEKYYNLREEKIFNNLTARDFLQSVVTEIAMDTQKSGTALQNYTNLKNAVQNQRLSFSGVDADEEAMNLVKYQEAYNLSAKMIQIMSEIYNKLINETGV